MFLWKNRNYLMYVPFGEKKESDSRSYFIEEYLSPFLLLFLVKGINFRNRSIWNAFLNNTGKSYWFRSTNINKPRDSEITLRHRNTVTATAPENMSSTYKKLQLRIRDNYRRQKYGYL